MWQSVMQLFLLLGKIEGGKMASQIIMELKEKDYTISGGKNLPPEIVYKKRNYPEL